MINSSSEAIKASGLLTGGTIKSKNPRSEGRSRSSAAMRFSLVASLVVVLAVVYGSEAASLVKRDVQADVDRLTQLFKEMSTSVSAATQEMVEKMKTLEMTNAAQTYVEDSRAKIQPLMETVQSEATKLQEQVQPYLNNMEEHIKPLTDNFSAQVKPLTDMMEKLLQQVVDQSKTLLPPQ